MRRWLLALALAVIPTPAAAGVLGLDNPFPDATIVSPGIKLGYTFGPGGGFTYGLELTVLERTGPDLTAVIAQGPALNLSFTRRGAAQLRLGWELVSWFAGVEVGPALVHDRAGTHLGLGVSPWLGAFVVPYYTHTVTLGGATYRELGAYLKLPLCAGCPSGGGSTWDFDDDD